MSDDILPRGNLKASMCKSCGRLFASTEAFDRHKTGIEVENLTNNACLHSTQPVGLRVVAYVTAHGTTYEILGTYTDAKNYEVAAKVREGKLRRREKHVTDD